METTDSVIADLRDKVPLDSDEKVVTSCLARPLSFPLPVNHKQFSYGLLLLTNKKLVYVGAWPKAVLLSKPLKDLTSIGIEKNVLVAKELRTVLRISYEGGTELFDVGKTRPEGVTIETLAEQINQLRAREQETPTTSTVVICRYCGLKNKGDQPKCSGCGAPLPASG